MYSFFKRLFDIAFAIAVFPFAAVIAIGLIIYLTLKFKEGPFFSQRRAGLRGKPFMLYKFKTIPSKSAEGVKEQILDKDLMIIRNFGLDEIPQILNIFIGSMSWIGPRPLPVSYLPLYNERQKIRHDCLPGLIGLAQIKGGNALSWPHRFKYDQFYAKRLSLSLDFSILVFFLFKSPIRKETTVFSESFKGNK